MDEGNFPSFVSPGPFLALCVMGNACAIEWPISLSNLRRMSKSEIDETEKKILQNQELVQKVLESAKHVSAPMTLAEFRNLMNEWKKSVEVGRD